MNVAQVTWSMNASLLIYPAASCHMALLCHTALANRYVLPGPASVSSVLENHLMPVGIRHALAIQVMYPPVALCRLGHLRPLQVSLSSDQGSPLSLHVAPRIKDLAGDKYEDHWFCTHKCRPRSFLISECRLADISSSHSIPFLTKVLMPHSAAMP